MAERAVSLAISVMLLAVSLARPAISLAVSLAAPATSRAAELARSASPRALRTAVFMDKSSAERGLAEKLASIGGFQRAHTISVMYLFFTSRQTTTTKAVRGMANTSRRNG